jgi:acyl-CoA synthetase (AMP-forming)/AMP-acid ligase II
MERSVPLEPEALLGAFDNSRASFIDLDHAQVVSPGELRRVADELSRTLAAAGVGSAERVALVVGNGPGFITSLVAVLRIGACPLLLHADSPAPEVRRSALRFGASFALADALTPTDLEGVGFVARAISGAPWGAAVLGRLVGQPVDSDLSIAGVPLHPTSGTTGEPKVALRPGFAAVAEANHYVDTIGIDAGDLVLCTVPMSHAYGFGMCAMVPLVSGASVAAMRRFNAPAARRALAEHDVTIFPSSPATLDLLLFEAGSLRPPRRCITSAGAPLAEPTATQVRARWGTTVRPLYGTTETGGISVARPNHDSGAGRSVGPPMLGVEVELRPHDKEEGYLEGSSGRLWIRSSSMMAGYLAPSGIDRSPIRDGWFDTGDLAHIDDEGKLDLRGRVSEVINVFGNKVVPCEVEEVIAALDDVVEVKVYSAPNRWGSHSVKAAVVASNGLDARTVKSHCKNHLVAYKRPERVALVDRLPRSPAGKIVVAQLP